MQTEKKIQMISKVKDTSEETKPFYFNQAHTTLLTLTSEVILYHITDPNLRGNLIPHYHH